MNNVLKNDWLYSLMNRAVLKMIDSIHNEHSSQNDWLKLFQNNWQYSFMNIVALEMISCYGSF